MTKKAGIQNLYQVFKALQKAALPQNKKWFVPVFFASLAIAILDLLALSGLFLTLGVLTGVKTFSGPFIDQVLTHLNVEDSALYILVLLALLFVVKNGLASFFYWLQLRVIQKLVQGIAQHKLEEVMQTPFEDMVKTNGNHLTYDLNFICIWLSEGVILPLINFTTEAVVAIFIAVSLFVFHPQVIGVLLLTLVPVYVLILIVNRTQLVRLGKAQDNYSRSFTSWVFRLQSGYSSWKLTGKTQEIKSQILMLSKRVMALRRRVHFLQTQMGVRLLETIAIIALPVLYVSYNGLGAAGVLPVILLFATAAFRLLPSFNRMVGAISSINNKLDLLNHLPGRLHPKTTDELRNDWGQKIEIKYDETLTLQQIHFAYKDGKPLIYNQDLLFDKGKFYWIKGASGQGKTTLLHLISGIIQPNSGVIKLDGLPISTFRQQSYMSLFAYVPQEPFLLDLSIAQNVALSQDKIDEKKVKDVLNKSGLADWVDRHSQGIHTLLSDRGQQISGGEKQRLSLARALYQNAQILLLDEATNALDENTELAVLSTIKDLCKKENVTVIFVSHQKAIETFTDEVIDLNTQS